MTDDELSKRRATKRRELTLQLTSIGMHLQWSPHWEFTFRLTGRWWFMVMWLFAAAGVGVLGASIVLVVSQGITARDWRMLTLCGAMTTIAIWRSIALLKRMRETGTSE